MFTLNNVFLCLNRLGVKFFQISGCMLQLQQDRVGFMAVGRGVNARSVWAPSVSRISICGMERLRVWLCTWEGLIVVLLRTSPVRLSLPSLEGNSQLFWNVAGSGNPLSFDGQGLQCFLCSYAFSSGAPEEFIWWDAET